MNVLEKFYPYQLDAFKATEENDKGIVVMPTGTGKTFVQAGIIANDIVKNPGFRIYVVNAPRIMLSYQLFREVYGYLLNYNLDARYMTVHSGGAMDERDLEEMRKHTDVPFAEIKSTTSPSEVNEMIKTAKKQDLPLIFFSTYHSAGRIEQGRKGLQAINITLNDEAHYLTQEQFHDLNFDLKTERKYFFTATTQESASDEGRGMNNVKVFGDIIYELSPRVAIDMGMMVRPRMHFVTHKRGAAFTQDDVEKSLGNLVAESFRQHEYAITGTDAAKIIVATKGSKGIKSIIESNEIKRLMKGGVSVYAVSSNEEISNWVNGTNVTRQEFLKLMAEEGKDSSKRMIIVHYDILTEGIDVPGITGVLFLRGMSKSKFIQTYGRAARLDTDDRAAFATGEYGPEDLHLMDKPYAWVIVPTVTMDEVDTKDHIGNLITELRSFGFEPKNDMVISDSATGIGTVEGPEALIQIKKKSPSTGVFIENVEMKIEDERLANLTDNELLNEILNVA